MQIKIMWKESVNSLKKKKLGLVSLFVCSKHYVIASLSIGKLLKYVSENI